MMSRSLTRVGQAPGRAGELDAVGGRVRAQRRRRSPRRSAAPGAAASRGAASRRRRRRTPRAPPPRTSGRSPRTSRSCSPSAAARSASSESMPSSSKSLRARLGPRPGRRVMSISPGGNFARSFSAAGIVPVSSSATIFSSSVLPMPGQRRDLALARERGDRHAAPRAPPWPRCGRRARGGRSRRRARRGRRARRSSAAIVAFGGVGGTAVRLGYVARRCPAPPGSSSRPTTRPRTSRRSSRAALRRARARRAATATGSSSSTTTRPTAPARSPTGSPPSIDEVEVLHRPAPRGPRARVPRRLRPRAATAAPGSCSRWTPTSRTTPPTSRACSPPCATAPTSRSARATSPGGGVADWGRVRRAVSRGGSWYARRVLGARRARPHRRLQVLPRARCSRRSTCRPCARTATPSRSS